MELTSSRYGNLVVVVPAGRLDHVAAGAFEGVLLPLCQDPATAAVVLDFSAVTYISSIGLRVLMVAAKQMRGRHARIAVAGLQSIVAEIFAISRFDAVLEVFPAVRDALGVIAPDALAGYGAN